MKPYVVFAALSLLALTAHADLHKWVDAEGKVHYSDIVPPEVSKTETVSNVSGKGQAQAPVQYSTKSYAERDAELRKSREERTETAEKKAQKDADAEARKRNCLAAQQNLRALEEGARIFNYDANGERVYLDDAGREQRMAEVRKNISANCD